MLNAVGTYGGGQVWFPTMEDLAARAVWACLPQAGSSPTPGTMEPVPVPRTRIAPTPSGFLHAGNAVNFLLTRRLADHLGAKLLLRIDDLDAGRVRDEYLQDIFDSLAWACISWDEGPQDVADHMTRWSQALRVERYLALADALRDSGHLYACTCSRKFIMQWSERGEACPCRSAKLPFDAPETSWRLAVEPGTLVRIPGLFGGEETVDLAASLGDVVLRQRDGMPAYQLASLADDVDRGITFIVRGADLLPSTACQLYLAGLLGLEAFLKVRFVHHGLVLDAQGQKLSKSAGADSLRSMREAGAGPAQLQAHAQEMFSALVTGQE